MKRGAFTGAIAQKIGRFELAHQGTLFLDEIGDIPLELQPKLLRALQEHEFERLGSIAHHSKWMRAWSPPPIAILRRWSTSTQFRTDLFYRLNVFPIRSRPCGSARTIFPCWFATSRSSLRGA